MKDLHRRKRFIPQLLKKILWSQKTSKCVETSRKIVKNSTKPSRIFPLIYRQNLFKFCGKLECFRKNKPNSEVSFVFHETFLGFAQNFKRFRSKGFVGVSRGKYF